MELNYLNHPQMHLYCLNKCICTGFYFGLVHTEVIRGFWSKVIVTAIQKVSASETEVLMKAFNNVCVALGVSTSQASLILGVNASTLSRNANKGFSPQSKTGELQLHFVRLYRALFAIAGGDSGFMNHWYRTNNKVLGGVPAQLCQSISGLIRINEYLDAMRGKV